MPVQRIGDLDIDQDLVFQHKQWRVQRGAWLVGLLVLLLALTGLFGDGPLANASVSDTANGLTVDYQRIDRRHSPSTISLEVIPAGTQPTLQLWIADAYLDDLTIDSIEPEPSTMTAEGDRVIMEFETGGAGPVDISFVVEHEQFGVSEAEIGLVDGPRVEFRQVILP